MKPSSAGTSRSHTNKQTLTPRGCLSACLSGCRRDSVIHTNANTHLGISLPRLPPLSFPFLLAPARSPRTPFASKYKQINLPSTCWRRAWPVRGILSVMNRLRGREGCRRMHRDGRYGGVSFQLRKLPSNSRAHYEWLRVENCRSAVFFLCNPPKKLLSSHTTFTLSSVHKIT